MNRHFGTVDITGIDILGIDIVGVDILGIAIPAPTHVSPNVNSFYFNSSVWVTEFSFWEIDVRLVGHMFSSSFVYLYFYLFPILVLREEFGF